MLERPITEYLSWDETKNVSSFVREQGTKQFIAVYNEWKDRGGDPFKWGDEVRNYSSNEMVYI